MYGSRIFWGDRFGGKEGGLRTYKPSSQEVADDIDSCVKRLRSLNFNKISKTEIKRFKTFSG
jgi:hypothetical protein